MSILIFCDKSHHVSNKRLGILAASPLSGLVVNKIWSQASRNTATQYTQNISITFVQCWTNVEYVGPTLYKCYAYVMWLLGNCHVLSRAAVMLILFQCSVQHGRVKYYSRDEIKIDQLLIRLIIYSTRTIASNVHARILNSLEHCIICITTMTSITR